MPQYTIWAGLINLGLVHCEICKICKSYVYNDTYITRTACSFFCFFHFFGPPFLLSGNISMDFSDHEKNLNILKIVLSEFCNFNSETIYFWKKKSLEFHRNWWNTPITLINSNSNSNYFFQEIFNSNSNSNSRVENYFNSNSNSGVIGINYFNSQFHVELNPTLVLTYMFSISMCRGKDPPFLPDPHLRLPFFRVWPAPKTPFF